MFFQYGCVFYKILCHRLRGVLRMERGGVMAFAEFDGRYDIVSIVSLICEQSFHEESASTRFIAKPK
jgi:hypothetical protein